jgi:hypothetical protein
LAVNKIKPMQIKRSKKLLKSRPMQLLVASFRWSGQS